MMGREGQVEDVAHAAAFLAAPESGWITGQVLRVDGGRMDFFGRPDMATSTMARSGDQFRIWG